MTDCSQQVPQDSSRPGGQMEAGRDDTRAPRRDPRIAKPRPPNHRAVLQRMSEASVRMSPRTERTLEAACTPAPPARLLPIALAATTGNRDHGTNDLLMSEMFRTNELQVWFLAEHLVNVPVVQLDQPGGGGRDADVDR
jgi:hypothetical protein